MCQREEFRSLTKQLTQQRVRISLNKHPDVKEEGMEMVRVDSLHTI